MIHSVPVSFSLNSFEGLSYTVLPLLWGLLLHVLLGTLYGMLCPQPWGYIFTPLVGVQDHTGSDFYLGYVFILCLHI